MIHKVQIEGWLDGDLWGPLNVSSRFKGSKVLFGAGTGQHMMLRTFHNNFFSFAPKGMGWKPRLISAHPFQIIQINSQTDEGGKCGYIEP